MFNEIIQNIPNTVPNSSIHTFVYTKPTFLGLPITEINSVKALIENFPELKKPSQPHGILIQIRGMKIGRSLYEVETDIVKFLMVEYTGIS